MNNRGKSESFISAHMDRNNPEIPPKIVIKTENAYEAMCMLCALCGEVVLTHSRCEKGLAISMINDLNNAMNMMYEKIINDLD